MIYTVYDDTNGMTFSHSSIFSVMQFVEGRYRAGTWGYKLEWDYFGRYTRYLVFYNSNNEPTFYISMGSAFNS